MNDRMKLVCDITMLIILPNRKDILLVSLCLNCSVQIQLKTSGVGLLLGAFNSQEGRKCFI